MRAEFDEYAQNYSELQKDPLRSCFDFSRHFFARRMLDFTREFFRRYGQDTREISRLDVGRGRGDLIRLAQSHSQTWSSLAFRRQALPGTFARVP
jgi:hypothetical protein